MSLVEIDSIEAGYGGSPVISDVSLSIDENTVVALLGRNGVGKTTTLRTIVGELSAAKGTISFDGEDITRITPAEAYRRGMSLVPEDRGIFPDLTVEENLKTPVPRETTAENSIEDLFELFPQLEPRRAADGINLSGGEQQMLAIARALRYEPRFLMLDEPSEGLAPQIVENLATIITDIARNNTILLVEQNLRLALDMASYVYVMEDGEIVYEADAATAKDEQSKVESHLQV